MNKDAIRKYILYHLFFSLILLSTYLPAHGQLPLQTDSLKLALKHAPADTDRVKILVSLSQGSKCSDSTAKVTFATEALHISEQINWPRGLLEANFALGNAYQNCYKNYERSIQYYLRADSIAQIMGDRYKQAGILQNVALVFQKASKFKEAMAYNRAVLALKYGPEFDISTYANMGVIYSTVGDLRNSLIYYDSALKLEDQYIRTSNRSDIYDSIELDGLLIAIGDIHLNMALYEEALSNYGKSLELSKQIKNTNEVVAALTGLARTYQHTHQYGRASEYYSYALDSCKELNDKKPETEILHSLSGLYLEEKDPNTALKYARHALQVAVANNVTDLVPAIYTTLGKIHYSLKEFNKSLQYLDSAIIIARRSELLDVEKDALEAISQTYKAMGEPAQALDAFQQFIAIRDSLYNIAKANELNRIDLQTEYERKHITDSVNEAQKAYEQGLQAQLKYQRQRAYTWGGYGGLAAVLLLSFFIYRNYSHEKKANAKITKANETISEQKQVTETLLLNILPVNVAEELKEKGKVKARLYENVSVLFTDFVNFTSAGEHRPPEELVDELHACFEAFDNIIGKYNVEKIKTVGDGYIAVSGLPGANRHHARDLVMVALEIRDFIEARKKELGDRAFGIRLGINSGKLVAGIVGVKKFAYDIWGDTVNTAARMEQTSEEGKVNVSQATYDLIKDDFAFTYRGKLEAKNKGRLEMYFADWKSENEKST